MAPEASARLLMEVEAAIDAEYQKLPLPHPDKYLATWYLLTVSEDYTRNLLVGMSRVGEKRIAYEIDRLKYSLKFGLERIYREIPADRAVTVPQRVVPMLYTRAAELLHGGKEFADGHQLCSAAHSGTVTIVATGTIVEVVVDEKAHDKGYAALELMGHGGAPIIDHATLLYAWVREYRSPKVVEWIASFTTSKQRLLRYHYDQELAIALAREMSQADPLIPEHWHFRWGGRATTTVLLNALCVRCLYHLVAIHFGALKLGLRGGGESNILLVLTSEQLALDIESMSSIPLTEVQSFISFLTYGSDTKTPDPALQPLIPLGPLQLGVPCLHFLSSNRERNLLSLQARVDKRSFDESSRLFEQQMVADLARQVPKTWSVRCNSKPAGHTGEELDLLIGDARSRTLLICELRWMLQPGDPREVKQRRNVCYEKVNQLERKVQWARTNLQKLLSRAFDQPVDDTNDWRVEGIVVIENFGGARSQRRELPVMTTPMFEVGIKRFAELAEFAAWSQSLEWLPQEGVHFEISDNEYELAGMKLVVPGMVQLQSATEYMTHVEHTLVANDRLS